MKTIVNGISFRFNPIGQNLVCPECHKTNCIILSEADAVRLVDAKCPHCHRCHISDNVPRELLKEIYEYRWNGVPLGGHPSSATRALDVMGYTK